MKRLLIILVLIIAQLNTNERADAQIPMTNMVWIQPGTFIMGSPPSEAGHSPDEEQHNVTITTGFYVGKYQVTQSEYQALIGINPSFYKITGNPVEQVNWFEATNYCIQLTLQEQIAGHLTTSWVYRLPTDAEREYFCRAGTTTAFSSGDSFIGGMANYYDYYEYDPSVGSIYNPDPVVPYINRPTTVGSYPPNPWGLYDTQGNVAEWCQDLYDLDYYMYPIDSIDPQGSSVGNYHVIRGCGYDQGPGECRSADRQTFIGSFARIADLGFRIVLSPTIPAWKQNINTPFSHHPYGTYPGRQSGKNNLILITHGWIPPTELPSYSVAWVNDMSNDISAYLTSNNLTNWQVVGYKWIDGAHTPLIPDLGPQGAINNGIMDGGNLGKAIAVEGWSKVHLIAHSAGASLIQACSEMIKATSSNIVVQCTFLDAFVGLDYAGIEKYGQGANWADSYFTRDDGTGGENFPFTQGPLDHSYNIDVTQLDPTKVVYNSFSSGAIGQCYTTKSSHGWPITFYTDTIIDSLSGSSGLGFPLSNEGGNWGGDLGQYITGNAVPQVLGFPDPVCNNNDTYATTPAYIGSPINFGGYNTLRSSTGIIQRNNLELRLTTDSPAWLAVLVPVTNAINFISFDAQFLSDAGAAGLLSINWDTNTVGFVDEANIQSGYHHYTMKFLAATNGSYMLGFRLDPYSNTPSTVSMTNVVLGYAGVSQPFTLSVTTNTANGSPVFQLTGQPGFNYTVQASTNLSDWNAIAILINTNGTVPFVDLNSTNFYQRFYRAVAPF